MTDARTIAETMMEKAKHNLATQGYLESLVLFLSNSEMHILPLEFETEAQKRILREQIIPQLARQVQADYVVFIMDTLFKRVGLFDHVPDTLYGDPKAQDSIMVSVVSRKEKVTLMCLYHKDITGFVFEDEIIDDQTMTLRSEWTDRLDLSLPPVEVN